MRSNCGPKGNRPHMLPVMRDAAFHCADDSRVKELFSLRRSKCFCAELRGPAGSTMTTGVYSVRKKMTTVLASSKRTTGFCTVVGVTRRNSRVMYTSTLCNNACGLFTRAVHGVNIGTAFMSPSYARRRLGTTFRRGAGTIFKRAVTGPTLAVFSFRGFTGTTRTRGMPLVMSGAFTAPVGYHPFR